MIQSLRILRKDARHLWPELTLHTALLIAFAWIIQLTRQSDGARGTPWVNVSLFFVRVLIPILWLVLTSRLVHDESLVGDQQFWITRPYTWPSLLGAKLLFLAAFVWLPFLIMQGALLALSGVNPFLAIPSLLHNLLFLILIAFLPFLALASITSTFPRLALAIIGTILYFIAGAATLAYFVGLRSSPPAVAIAVLILAALAVLGVLTYQYATRRTLIARIALYAIPSLIVVLGLAVPAGPLFRHSYPVDTTATLTYIADPAMHESQLGVRAVFNHNLTVNIPTHLTGLAPDTQLQPTSVAYTIDGPGLHYAAPWQYGGSGSIAVPEKILDALGDTPVHLHLSIAAASLVPGTPATITANQRFTLPGDGVCVFPGDNSDDTTETPRCSFPFHVGAAIVSAPLSPVPCTQYSAADPNQMRTGAINFHQQPPLPAFDPVASQYLSPGAGFLCPGAPLTYTPMVSGPNRRFELDIPSIQLSAYILHINPRLRIPQFPPNAPPPQEPQP
jgi:hypothetical protein